MTKRILIVEHEGALALEMAAVLHADGFSTSIAPSASDAFREMEERRPDLLFVRAELPEQNGFSLCAKVRRTAGLRDLPIVLASSDSAPEALEQHAAHPNFAANAYLLAPYGMDDLRAAVHALVGPDPVDAADVEPANGGPAEADPDGAASLGADLKEDLGGEAPTDPRAAFPEHGQAPTPPKLPRRERRGALTEDDKAFLDRVFGTIADRKGELLVEARGGPRRSRVGRDLINTPEGKLQLLRDELRSREAQIARLSEIWAIRDRELAQGDDRLHEKEVEIQGLKMKAEDLVARLAEARGLFLRKEREHGQIVDEMHQRQFSLEKELIEVVAGKEKEIDRLRRDLSNRGSEIEEQTAALEAVARNRDERIAERDFAAAEGMRREAELLTALAGREVSIALLEAALQAMASRHSLAALEAARRDAAERKELCEAIRDGERAVAGLEWRVREALAREAETARLAADREAELAAYAAVLGEELT
ncbi:MAG TPA: response regulator, partial [Vulgatibacter sp.]